jgi:hypothetical protein
MVEFLLKAPSFIPMLGTLSIYRSGPSFYSSFIQEHLPFLFLPFTLSPSFIANGHWRVASSEGRKQGISAFPPLLATRHLHLVSFLNAPNLSLVSERSSKGEVPFVQDPSLALYETCIQPASFTTSQSFTKTHTHTRTPDAPISSPPCRTETTTHTERGILGNSRHDGRDPLPSRHLRPRHTLGPHPNTRLTLFTSPPQLAQAPQIVLARSSYG